MKKLKCHCGAVEAEINLPGNLEKVLRCNCSLCKRKMTCHYIPLLHCGHRKFFVINIIMTYCALAAHLCFMQTIVLSPYMTTFMALAKDYGSRMTKCVLTATRTREVWSVKLIAQILAATNHWFCFEK